MKATGKGGEVEGKWAVARVMEYLYEGFSAIEEPALIMEGFTPCKNPAKPFNVHILQQIFDTCRTYSYQSTGTVCASGSIVDIGNVMEGNDLLSKEFCDILLISRYRGVFLIEVCANEGFVPYKKEQADRYERTFPIFSKALGIDIPPTCIRKVITFPNATQDSWPARPPEYLFLTKEIISNAENFLGFFQREANPALNEESYLRLLMAFMCTHLAKVKRPPGLSPGIQGEMQLDTKGLSECAAVKEASGKFARMNRPKYGSVIFYTLKQQNCFLSSASFLTIVGIAGSGKTDIFMEKIRTLLVRDSSARVLLVASNTIAECIYKPHLRNALKEMFEHLLNKRLIFSSDILTGNCNYSPEDLQQMHIFIEELDLAYHSKLSEEIATHMTTYDPYLSSEPKEPGDPDETISN